jgi:hypothetical protein
VVVAAVVLVIGLIVAGVLVLGGGGGGDDDTKATDTTATTAGGGDAPSAPTAELASSFTVAAGDLPATFTRDGDGSIVDLSANPDPCLARLPRDYALLVSGATFSQSDAGLQVTSNVGMTTRAADGAADAIVLGSDDFLACVRTATQQATEGRVDQVTVERLPELAFDDYVTGWIIKIVVGDQVAQSESVVLHRGRAIVTVHMESGANEFDPGLRTTILTAVSTRLQASED